MFSPVHDKLGILYLGLLPFLSSCVTVDVEGQTNPKKGRSLGLASVILLDSHGKARIGCYSVRHPFRG